MKKVKATKRMLRKPLPYKKPAIVEVRKLDVMAGACGGEPPEEKMSAGSCITVVLNS